MESHNSCEKLVAAEAGLESLKKPKGLSFVKISRRKGSLTTFVNYLFILFAITLLAIISWEIWQMVRREKLIKQIEIQNTHRNNERLMEDERFKDVVEQLNRMKNKLTELEEKYEQQDVIPETTESPMETSIQPEVPDIQQYLEDDWLKLFEVENNMSDLELMNLNFSFPTLKVKEEDLSLDLDKSDSSIPVTIAESIEETESGIRWIFNFYFGGNSEEDDTSEELDVNESKEMGAMPTVEKETSEEGWTGYIPRIISTPFKNTFGMSWGWSSLINNDDNQSSESAEEVEEKINSVEIETVSTTVAPTTDSSSKNFDDYNYNYSYDSGYDDYAITLDENFDTTPSEEITKSSSMTAETVLEVQNFTTESIPTTTVQEIFEDLDHPTSTETQEISESSSSDESDDDHINFWNIFGDGADTVTEVPEDGLKSTEVFLEDSSSNQDDLSESERIDRFFEDLMMKRIADAALLQQQYAMIFEADPYYDYGNEEYYEDENPDVTEQPLTSVDDDWNNLSNHSVNPEELETPTTESSLTSTIQENLEEVDVETTEDPQVSESFSDEKPLEFPAFYYPGLKSAIDTLEESSKPDDILSSLLPFPAYEDDEEYTDSDYVEDGWSYISKRSVDTPSASEVPGEHLSAKELEHKMVILRQAIDDDNHFLQNEVSLTSEPTKQYLQSKLNNFYSKMERVSAHIDRLHERYLKLNKLDDDYISRELPVE